MYYCFRLHRGDDLKEAIVQYCAENKISSAAIVTAVGCLYQANIRLADGKSTMILKNRYEIVSLTGTICRDGAHLHISIADEKGNVLGGHLMSQSFVNTTCEIVVTDLNNQYSFTRELDQSTGYKELVINKEEE